jgi:hypothetical protein
VGALEVEGLLAAKGFRPIIPYRNVCLIHLVPQYLHDFKNLACLTVCYEYYHMNWATCVALCSVVDGSCNLLFQLCLEIAKTNRRLGSLCMGVYLTLCFGD